MLKKYKGPHNQDVIRNPFITHSDHKMIVLPDDQKMIHIEVERNNQGDHRIKKTEMLPHRIRIGELAAMSDWMTYD